MIKRNMTRVFESLWCFKKYKCLLEVNKHVLCLIELKQNVMFLCMSS